MAMEIKPPLSSQRGEEPELMNLKEWGVKARMISRDNTLSRRFSSSHITSFREDGCKSFRSNFTISSTASSPGYSLREEIDPSTYSFTNALKALQLRTINTWEYLSPPPEGFALNSKWNEAERYICNPLSGEVPMECLSSKTLMKGRSFRNITNRMSMSAPLIHHSSRLFQSVSLQQQHKLANIHPIQDDIEAKENKVEGKMIMKRDVGIQSTPTERSPSPTPASTPPIHERSMKINLALQAMNSLNSSSQSKSENQPEIKEVERAKEEETKKDDEDDETLRQQQKQKQKQKSKKYMCICRQGTAGGCLFFKNLWSRKNHKPRNKNLCPSN